MNVSTKYYLFSVATSILNLCHVDGFLGRNHRGLGAIIVLHSVVENTGEFLDDELRTDLIYLDRLIGHLIDKKIDIINLDQAIQRLQERRLEPFIVFTFDDGFKDNLTLALPVFQKYHAPFTVYVTNCMIEKRINNWWSGLAEIIKFHDEVTIDEMGVTFKAPSRKKKNKLYSILKEKISNSVISELGLNYLFTKYSIDMERIIEKDALTIEQLKKLAASPLVDMGGHTVNHPQLSMLNENEVSDELIRNKLWLENLIDQEVRHVAYPFGDIASCGERESNIAKYSGFKTGVTTRIGNLFEEHLGNLTALPRIRPFNRYRSTRLVDAQLSGAAGALLNRSHGPVVTM